MSQHTTDAEYPMNKLSKHLERSFEILSSIDAVSTLLKKCLQDVFLEAPEWNSQLDELYTVFESFDGVEKNALYDFLLYFSSIRPRHYFPSEDSLVPVEFRVVTSNQHCYDIRALLKQPAIINQSLIDPILEKPFHILDQRRIFNHGRSCGLAIDYHPEVIGEKTQIKAGFRAENYCVVKAKTGEVIPFDMKRLEKVVLAAYRAVKPELASDVAWIEQKIDQVVYSALMKLRSRYPNGGIVHTETIQDMIEASISACDDHDVLRAYVLYRSERERTREESSTHYEPAIRVLMPNGQLKELDRDGLLSFLTHLSQDYPEVDPKLILEDAYRNLFDKVPYVDVNNALIMSCRAYIERDPSYSFVASRLLKHRLCEEVIGYFEKRPIQIKQVDFPYNSLLEPYVTQGIAVGRLDKRLIDFNLPKLSQAIDCSRDDLITFMSLQNLYDRYFIHVNSVRVELPQIFFMRIAMGLAVEESNKDEKAIEFYNQISQMNYMPSTPTLFNSGTVHSQLSSCFLTTIPDDLEGIFEIIKENGMLSKWSGGIGNDWTPVRANGAHIKGTNGRSSGVIPYIKIVDSMAIAVNQGGKRKGAVVGYLETWHMDIEDFLDLRKNSGDDRRRSHDMNTANWIPDLFMKRVMQQKKWTLFSPDEVPGLHDSYGLEFEKLYTDFEVKAEAGLIRSKKVEAVTLWRKMLTALYETGHPWMTFKDPSNIRSPQQHCGVVHGSNLCTEITLNTSDKEIAVCNLGSLNIPSFFDGASLQWDKLASTIQIAVRMLDNVLDVNFYSVEKAKYSNQKHRPVGLGLMGFQDALYLLGIPYDSIDAVQFADELMEFIAFHAISASIDLAKERGPYSTYQGSLWSQGVLPIDSIQTLKEARGEYLDQDTSMKMNWDSIRTKLKTYGMRNSNVMAIAPTATISNIANTSQSIDPCYMNLQVKSNMSGEFTVINPYLIRDLKALGLWDALMAHDLKRYDGSVQKIERVPENLKRLYKTAFEIDPRWLVDAGSRRQKWLDQAQSLNLYLASPSGKKLDELYKHAWLKGLKTTYYLRTLGASSVEKSTISDRELNLVKPTAKACSIDEPDCEACQ